MNTSHGEEMTRATLVRALKRLDAEFQKVRLDWSRGHVDWAEMARKCRELRTQLQAAVDDHIDIDWSTPGDDLDQLGDLLNGLQLEIASYVGPIYLWEKHGLAREEERATAAAPTPMPSGAENQPSPSAPKPHYVFSRTTVQREDMEFHFFADSEYVGRSEIDPGPLLHSLRVKPAWVRSRTWSSMSVPASRLLEQYHSLLGDYPFFESSRESEWNVDLLADLSYEVKTIKKWDIVVQPELAALWFYGGRLQPTRRLLSLQEALIDPTQTAVSIPVADELGFESVYRVIATTRASAAWGQGVGPALYEGMKASDYVSVQLDAA